MGDTTQLLVTLVAVAVALPAAYYAVKKRLIEELEKRLDQISGGRLTTVEDLVGAALEEQRLREETVIHVYGPESLWTELRRGRFTGAIRASSEGPPAPVAVVDAESVPEEAIRTLQEPYVLLYKEGPPYRGDLPAGAQVTFANSGITLDARLLEALRHRHTRS